MIIVVTGPEREALGRAAAFPFTWEHLTETERERYRAIAVSVLVEQKRRARRRTALVCEFIAATERGRNERRPCAACDGSGYDCPGSEMAFACERCRGDGIEPSRADRLAQEAARDAAAEARRAGELARRAALTPEQRAAEDERNEFLARALDHTRALLHGSDYPELKARRFVPVGD